MGNAAPLESFHSVGSVILRVRSGKDSKWLFAKRDLVSINGMGSAERSFE